MGNIYILIFIFTCMIKEKLEKIGLTAGESEVYELLIETGQTKAGTLIKKASLASSKVYDVLQKLVNKGLASFVVKDGIKHYQATPPERLVDFLEEKKTHINKAQEEMVKLIPLIRERNDSKTNESNVRMYLGPEGPKIILKELIEASIREGTNYGYGTRDNPFVEIYPHELNEFFNEEKKHKFKTLLLFAKGNRQSQPSAKIKYLSPEFFSPVRTMIAGDKVFLVDFTKPYTSIIIENKQVAESYKEHFLMLWGMAKPYPKLPGK